MNQWKQDILLENIYHDIGIQFFLNKFKKENPYKVMRSLVKVKAV